MGVYKCAGRKTTICNPRESLGDIMITVARAPPSECNANCALVCFPVSDTKKMIQFITEQHSNVLGHSIVCVCVCMRKETSNNHRKQPHNKKYIIS